VTPGAQIAAAIEILAAIEGAARPADDIAAHYFRQRRYIGAKDRARISDHVYGVLRRRAALDWWIGRFGIAAEARSRLLAALILLEGWDPQAVAAACDGGRFRPAPPAATEARLLDALAGHTIDHPQMPRSVRSGLPDWLEPYFARALGATFERELAALNEAAPLDLRVNLLKADRKAAQRALAADRVMAEATPLSPVGLRLRGRAPLGDLAAFREGLVEVQDEGSQLAALLAGARAGMRVLDFCAGAGGKTLALAAAMRNRGRLVACDVSAERLQRSARRLTRAGVGNVERRVLEANGDKWLKRQRQGFDRVFVDAPCLGTGAWRRNPAEKWRATPDHLTALLPRQREILRRAAPLVRPGGRLVYATCSLLVEENED
jgi:16S rRNA (cytosine967-C5)-methyltransferase